MLLSYLGVPALVVIVEGEETLEIPKSPIFATKFFVMRMIASNLSTTVLVLEHLLSDGSSETVKKVRNGLLHILSVRKDFIPCASMRKALKDAKQKKSKLIT